jgi:hypothetical protein
VRVMPTTSPVLPAIHCIFLRCIATRFPRSLDHPYQHPPNPPQGRCNALLSSAAFGERASPLRYTRTTINLNWFAHRLFFQPWIMNSPVLRGSLRSVTLQELLEHCNPERKGCKDQRLSTSMRMRIHNNSAMCCTRCRHQSVTWLTP